jgi:membrane-bound serine protease (ClpP class)
MINQAHAEALKNKMEEAIAAGAERIILEMDTPGGTVQASQDLGDYIFAKVEVPVVAYINTKAYSGGTMVALACDDIYIDEKIGMMGDVAPITGAGEEVGEKFQAPIRKTMANYAEARGYPVALVEAMVTKDIEVYRVQMMDDPPDHFQYLRSTELDLMPEKERAKVKTKDLVSPKGELLTLSGKDAVRYGFAREAVSSRLDLYDTLDVDPDNVKRLYLSATERLLTILDAVSPLLIAGGLLLLFIEMNNPGFGLPGILGIACLVTFFVVKHTLKYAEAFEIVLFAAGVVLLALEILVIPGFGIAGVAGIVLIFVSLVLMLQDFDIPHSPSEVEAFQFNIVEVLGVFVGTAFGLLILARFLGSVPFLKRLVRTETLAGSTLVAPSTAGGENEEMMGREGIAVTALRPAGRAQFGEREADVVARGEFIEKGTRVEVVGVRASRLTVRPVEHA